MFADNYIELAKSAMLEWANNFAFLITVKNTSLDGEFKRSYITQLKIRDIKLAFYCHV